MLALTSCQGVKPIWRDPPRSWPDITPTQIDYVDEDGFDALFETALINQDPVIVVRTGRTQPDWSGRLNAWIAAWNRGAGSSSRKPARRSEANNRPRPIIRAQAPLPKVALDGDSIRELRLLVGTLLDRIEDLAHTGASWWTEERARSRRVTLLKPYNLRFHMDDEGQIQLVFFHGNYASYYPRFVQLLTRSSTMNETEWSRTVECSHCNKWDRDRIDWLTGFEAQ
jgi:hypothetical protein